MKNIMSILNNADDSSTEDERHCVSEDTPSPTTEEDSVDAFMRDFEKLSTTPPRTRILRRDRSKEQSRCKHRNRRCQGHGKFLRKVINGGKRYLNSHLSLLGQFEGESEGDPDNKKRMSKRTMQRLRGSERDLKLDIDVKDGVTPEADNLPTFKVESSNRFLSLSCKLVKTAIHNWRTVLPEGSGRSRIEFHDNFVELIKSGNNEKDKNCKRQLSREEHLWQTELKDMIWLELQAWRADKTPTQQDYYLCSEREMVPNLLVEILSYRFEKKPEGLSAQSSDSGIQLTSDSDMLACSGCLSLFCPTCMEHENAALHEVQDLMHRLEKAEALFPSSKVFGTQFPPYRSSDFIGRVKAMCLWYNIMRHHRLKLLILGKQLLSYAASNDPDKSTTNRSPDLSDIAEWDFYNTQPLQLLGRYFQSVDSGDTRTYRKFIEDVLKVRGLRKALFFLDHLYLKVLRKGRIALERPKFGEDISSPNEDENELRRYGYWSPESQSLNLPSFRPAFLFISRIPIDVIHEFLCMRLETKLDKPSSLSIRQLIKELKEGLRLAVLNKHRYLQHCEVALCDVDEETRNKFKNYIVSFDERVEAVFNLYLNYLQQWVSMTQRERHQKNILEEEWKFITGTASSIPGGETVASDVFCNIASSMLLSISNELKNTVNNLKEEYCESSEECSLNSLSRQTVLGICREFQSLFLETRERTFRVVSLTKTLTKYLENILCFDEIPSEKIIESLDKLKDSVAEMCEALREIAVLVDETMLAPYIEDNENTAGQSRCREVLHQIYKFAFDFQKESVRFTNDKCLAARTMIEFAQQWMRFVINHCEKGRGVRPRWASYGLDFLVTVVDPKYTSFLTEKEFELLRKDIESCISHIMGAPNATTTWHSYLPRSSSPSPSVSFHKLSFSSSDHSPHSSENDCYKYLAADPSSRIRNRHERIVNAVEELDAKLDAKLRDADLIGNLVIVSTPNVERNYIRPRTVNFPWQRGIKIGQGRFGKVYTAVNTDTGELMAMKEISLQPNDIRTIRRVGLEFKIFEGIVHNHLVRYYGAEVHREELLIFMELCTEGTLESLVAATESGLPEGLVRRYTSQLVSSISTLHSHSIVHRDIKTANIFLTAEGNCLKLGDFGSAVKIRAHTTAPGELKGFVGTQAYMAPEVFMKSNTVGHGRAADIWSLGCVIIEMVSGKRPWYQFDSNYQIMFKVGMGELPEFPSNISDEGQNFISKCIQHNPKNRATTLHLRQHTFLKVDSEEECLLFNMPSVLEDYLKLGIKR